MSTTKNNPPSGDELRWIDPGQNPWGVRLLDVRAITRKMISTSADPQCAANATSFGGDDGTGFIGVPPVVPDSFPAGLLYPVDRGLADGVLFVPGVMEQKWAIFHHLGKILFVRSWTRKVHLIADIRQAGDHIEITKITGALLGEEKPEFIVRAVDFMLRSHALGLNYPAPLPADLADDPQRAAIWCFSSFGNRAWFATPDTIVFQEPKQPLRTHSLLHIAVARGDLAGINDCLDRGFTFDLLAGDGLAPLHWACSRRDLDAARLLLQCGSSIDVRSDEGATPLMNAVRNGNEEQTRFFLDHGADPNAADMRGFTALHRAAEMGHTSVVKILLERGADPAPEAEGHTPQSLAEQHGRDEIVQLLKKK